MKAICGGKYFPSAHVPLYLVIKKRSHDRKRKEEKQNGAAVQLRSVFYIRSPKQAPELRQASMRSSLLYFATRSLLHGAPDFIK